MRKGSFQVFDDIVSGAPVVYTSTALNDRLASHNQLGVFAVIDNVSGSGIFDIWIEHSCDARNWLQRNDSTQTSPPIYTGTGDIHVASLSSGATIVRAYMDPAVVNPLNYGATSPGPLLSYVRLSIKLGSGVTQAHVKIHVVQRDM